MLSGLTGTEILLLFIALVVSIVIHELMHGVVAYWLGDRTAAEAGRLTLNPMASIDPVITILIPFLLLITVGTPLLAAKPVPFNPDRVKWDEFGVALVGIAGPITNFILAAIGAAVYSITGAGQGMLHNFSYIFVLVNVGIMVFNLIPFPPLDGSRVLYAFAPEPLQRVMERIEQYGFIAVLVFIFVVFTFFAPVVSEIQRIIVSFLLRGAV